MRMELCSNCNKTTGHKRALGWGTLFAVILTGGLWLITIPFYQLRCIICGTSSGPSSAKNILPVLGVVVLFFFLVLLYVLSLDDSVIPGSFRN